MSDWAEDQDPYEILGLAQGHESTEAQIKKVCQYHAEHVLTPCGGKCLQHINILGFCLLAGIQAVGAEETS